MTDKKKFPWTYYLINAIFIVVAFLIFFNFLPKNWFHKKEAVFYPEKERIEYKIPATGFIAKEEVMVTAPSDGKVKKIALAGELQSKLSNIIEITSSNGVVTKVTNQEEGFITYIQDHCEITHTLNAYLEKKLLLPEILTPNVKKEKVNDGQSVKKGEFIFKILKNKPIRYIVVIDSNSSVQIQKDNDYILSLNKPVNMMISGTIESVTPVENNKNIVVFSSAYYNDTMINERGVSGGFYFGFIDGYRIPNAAMGIEETKKNEKKYFLYIQDKAGNIQKKYVQVSTYLTNSKEFVISGYSAESGFSENIPVYKEKLHAEKILSQRAK